MYNEEQKKRYLNFCRGKLTEESVSLIVGTFNRIESFEKLYEKDCAEFGPSEISGMYGCLNYKNEFGYSTVNSRLAGYTDWCIGENIVAINHYNEFGLSDYVRYVNTRLITLRYMTKSHFEKFCGSILNPRDEFFVRCLYEFGRSKDYAEILEMRFSDIDQQKKQVLLCTGRIVDVSEKLISCANQANAETTYVIPVREAKKPLEDGSTIFRRIVRSGSRAPGVNYVNSLMASIARNTGEVKGVNASTIAESGMFYYIARKAKELGITPEEFVKDHWDELVNQYITIPKPAFKFIRVYGQYLYIGQE